MSRVILDLVANPVKVLSVHVTYAHLRYLIVASLDPDGEGRCMR